MTGLFAAAPVLAILLGAVAGGGLLLLVTALRGMPPRRPGGRATALGAGCAPWPGRAARWPWWPACWCCC